MSSNNDLVFAYLSLGAQALLPIVLGSFKSLKTPRSTIQRRKKAARDPHKLLTEDEDDEDELYSEEESLDETLSWAESLLFPVLGSAVLLGLWVLLRYVDKKWINLVLGIYFSIAGVFAFQSSVSTLVRFFIRQTSYKPPIYHFRITSNLKQIFHMPVSLPALVIAPASLVLPLSYIALDRPYWLSNILALSLATSTLALLKLDSFFTAFLLLGLLLIYDIFWVFATPVMVTVAKGIDAPIKLLAPKQNPFTSTTLDFAMLGLGDIVVPGLIIALCLRFDLHRHTLRSPSEMTTKRTPFSRPYFVVGVVSYIIGLTVTMAVMHHTKKAQPALLYLSPACTIGPVLLALAKGELKLLWTYNDSPEDKDDNDKKASLDDTIEAPSAVAMQARQAAKEGKAAEVADEIADKVDGEGEKENEDDSWMEGVGVVGTEGKARKRKGNKKK